MDKVYKVLIAQSGKEDIKKKKQYILDKFKYRDYAENYSKKIKKAAMELDTFPAAYDSSGFTYRGYDVLFYPRYGHLLFYIVNDESRTVTILRVLQDGMDWQNIINEWIEINKLKHGY